MKSLTEAAKDYLAVRRALGFKLHHETWWLPSFVAYLKAHGSSIITSELALSWAKQPAGSQASYWAKRLSAVRHFARHHRASEPRTEVPAPDLIPCERHRQQPHIFTDAEIAALMRTASGLPDPLQASTHHTLIGLLAATGMRVGEAIGLDRHDVDWHRGALTVRHAKFNKTRELPLHHTTVAALEAYTRRRDRELPQPKSPSFFLSRVGTRLILQDVGRVFIRLRQRAAIPEHRGRGVRIHDLRHTFAVRTVERWYQQGVEVERRLPWLCTYLGHVSPSSTYWYLTGTPELLALASTRAARAWRKKS